MADAHLASTVTGSRDSLRTGYTYSTVRAHAVRHGATAYGYATDRVLLTVIACACVSAFILFVFIRYSNQYSS